MRAFPSDRLLGALGLGVVLAIGATAPTALRAQDATIVSKAVTVGTSEAGLAIGLADGSELDIRFEEGSVLIDGAVIGSYAQDGELEGTWRALVARAVQLDDGPLAEALVAWEPDSSLDQGALGVAKQIDARLEQVLLGTPTVAQAPDAPDVVDGSTLSRLFSRMEVLGDLGALLGEVDLDDIRIVIGDDLDVRRDMTLEGSVLVIDGDVEIAGRIEGDLFVVDGDIELLEGGLIEGDLRYVDGSLDFEGGEVRGSVAEIAGNAIVVDADFRDEITEEIRADLRAEARASAPRSRRVGILGRTGRAISDLFETLMTVFIMGLFGVMVSFFAGPNVDRVAEVARRSPGRAATVGFSAAFLSIPLWIIGIIGLALTIIGIPALIVWVPGLPILVGLAAGLGYVAVARNVGTWLTHRNFPGFEWVRVTRPNSLIFGGVVVLFLPFAVANVLGILPFLGGFQELATFVGVMLGIMATAAGFGAVLMTRGGKRTDYAGEDWYDDLQDLGADLGDLRGFASDFGRRWTGSDRADTEADETDVHDADVRDAEPHDAGAHTHSSGGPSEDEHTAETEHAVEDEHSAEDDDDAKAST